MTAAKRYSTPCCKTRVPITTAIAPVAPEIIPGRPPTMVAIKPIVKAAYKPVKGCKCASNAKATASGTNAKATVKPDNRSFLIHSLRLEMIVNMASLLWLVKWGASIPL